MYLSVRLHVAGKMGVSLREVTAVLVTVVVYKYRQYIVKLKLS